MNREDKMPKRICYVFSQIGIIVSISFLITSCQTISNKLWYEPTARGTGHVYISTPKIHTSERLLEDRIKHLQWLQTQLESSAAQGIQGLSINRTVTGATFGANIQADPTVLNNYRAGQDLINNNIERRNTINESTLELEKQQVSALQRQAEAQTKQFEEISRINTEIEAQRLEGIQYFNERMRSLQQEIDVASKSGKQTEVDRLKQLQADTISTLAPQYPTITTAGSGVPGPNGSSDTGIGSENTGSNTPSTEGSNQSVVIQVPSNSTNSFANTVKALSDQLADMGEQTEKLITDANTAASAGNINVTPIESFENALAYRNRIRDEISQVQLDDAHHLPGKRTHKFQFDVTILPQHEADAWLRVTMRVKPGARTVEQYDNIDLSAVSYAVSPKESVQQILEIGETKKIFGGELNAQFLAQNLGGQAFLQFMRQNEKIRQSIQRKPIVLGFSGKHASTRLYNAFTPFRSRRDAAEQECAIQDPNQSNGEHDWGCFGWIFGPAFNAKRKSGNGEYLHRGTTQTVSALIVTPKNWDDVVLDTKVEWLRGSSLRPARANLAEQDFQIASVLPKSIDPSSYYANKSCDINVNIDSNTLPPPCVYPKLLAEDNLIVEANSADLLIIGKELWREPKVSIGGVITSNVEILPNQAGLIARFNRPTSVVCKDESSCIVDVKVWTSSGVAEAGQVTIKRKLEKQPLSLVEAKFTTPASGDVELGSEIVIQFALNQEITDTGSMAIAIGGQRINKIAMLNGDATKKNFTATAKLLDLAWQCHSKNKEDFCNLPISFIYKNDIYTSDIRLKIKPKKT